MNFAGDTRAEPQPDTPIQVECRVNTHKGKVGLHFSHPIDNLQQDAEQSVNLAKALLRGAKMLDPKSVEGVTWQEN